MLLIKRPQFFYLAMLSITLIAGCTRSEQVGNLQVAEPGEPPFSNTEPDRYQTIIVQSSPAGTVKFLIARDGDKWRIDYEYGLPHQTGSLHVDEKDYVMDFATKSYGEYTAGHGFDERPGMVEEISHGLFNAREVANYEMIGNEGELSSYKMTNGTGKEAIITVDTAKGLPVKKEIYALADGDRRLEMTITLEDLRLEPDPANFELPKVFKRLPMDEMKKILTGGE